MSQLVVVLISIPGDQIVQTQYWGGHNYIMLSRNNTNNDQNI